jgi:anti-sigma B factor antagonist
MCVEPRNLLLEVIEVRDAGRVRVRLCGELDLASAPRLTECLRRLSERREQVLLDLDELTFIDMSGLRTLLTAAEDASRDGWEFTVTRGSAPVRRLVALVRLDGQLPVDGSSS